MITAETIKAYNAVRTAHDKSLLCHAPFTNLNFEQNGNVTACCYNREHVLGKYPEDNLLDIWFGKKADELRDYIKQNKLGGGCKLCETQLQSGNFHNSRAKGFDFVSDRKVVQLLKKAESLIKRRQSMQMPICMEFEISNTCNLECVMCNGYFSSSIRKNREQLPPMHNPYDDKFVEQVIPFLPYLKEARFLGGEPFLIDIYYQIWDAIAKINPKMRVSITSNGTVLNQRAKTLLDKLNCSIILSIDSINKETYERIRVNAKFERVWENFEYLYQYTRKEGRYMSFAVCPMTLNWEEMPDIVSFCNQKDIFVYFNTVTYPIDFALERMPLPLITKVRELYANSQAPANTFIGDYNNKVFADLLSHVESWYALALAVESDPTEEEDVVTANMVAQAIGTYIAEGDTKVLVEYVRYELRTSKHSANEHNESKRLSYRLTQLLNTIGPEQFILSLRFALPIVATQAFDEAQTNGIIHKFDTLLSEVKQLGKSEDIAKKMLDITPMQLLGFLAQQNLEDLTKQVHEEWR